jgi:ABC-2 type transport system ATP-binding protein
LALGVADTIYVDYRRPSGFSPPEKAHPFAEISEEKAIMAEKSVSSRGISKRYKSFFGAGVTVLKNISLDIEAGEIFGLLGPNGSGKTTLISIFSTLIYPKEGSLSILGLDARRDKGEIRKLINISTAKPNFPWSLTVQENLRHYGMLYGLYGSVLSRTIEDQIDAFELGEFRDRKFEDLSTGIKQRLSLAKAMLNHPRLLFLDEPTTGLDPDISFKTRALIKRIHEEEDISVVLSTHYMPEAEMLCDRIAFLRKGEIVALDTPQNLKNHLGLGERVVVTYDGPVDVVALENVSGVLGLKSSAGRAEIVIDRSMDNLDQIIKIFEGARILDINIKEPDLEDVFLELAR